MKKLLIIIIMLSSIFNFFGCKGQTDKPKKITQEDIDKSIKDFMNRPIYTNLTLKILDSINDDNLEQTIIDNIYAKLDSGNSYEKDYQIITSLSKGRQAVFATWGLEAEVNNGGFNQYFYNFASSGQYAEEARDGFKLIGAAKYSALTQKAIDMIMKNAKQLSKFRDGTLESFSKSYENNPLNDLDTEFYALDKSENLSKLRIKYIKEHKSEFIDN